MRTLTPTETTLGSLSPLELELVMNLRRMNEPARSDLLAVSVEYAKVSPLLRPLSLVRPRH